MKLTTFESVKHGNCGYYGVPTPACMMAKCVYVCGHEFDLFSSTRGYIEFHSD